ncbi:hypothetical protein F1D05_23335 [Kribbella qitaiheensis]|uniref:Uncharacterized protein n=1 Tax=Kribbella qitaiheensis TaxID=1544730 RepID=A0A7G6X241_9ACTN|nr:hypothetical protein [Kribbella qitaiheensis]QNE20306.1 hypothetical protein F1D05_23335 [Kribbella qitaiheensis]
MSQTVEKSPPVEAAPPDKAVGRLPRWISAGITALVLLAATAFFLSTAVDTGLPTGSAIAALLGLAVTQLVPGVLVWRVVRPMRGWWIEDVMMGLVTGFVLAVGAQALAGYTEQPWISAALPLLVAVVLIAMPRTRGRIRRVGTSNLPLWWAPAVVLTALFGLQDLKAFYVQEPLTWASGFRAPYVDTYLHLALAGQLKHRGPISFPWVQNEPMAYHWFSHAWVAQVSTVSNTGLDEVLLRFLPALMPLALVLVVAIAAVRISGRAWTGPVAAVLALGGSELNIFGIRTPGYPIAPFSPSLAPSILILIAIVVLLHFRWRRELTPYGFMLLPLLGFAASGTKGSSMPLIVAGVGLAFVATLIFDRSGFKSRIVDGVICVGALYLALAIVFQGATSGLSLQFHEAARATSLSSRVGVQTTATLAFAAIVTVLGICGRGTGLLWRLRTAEGRRDPMTWLLLGGGFAGAAAVVVFVQPGFSQYYFARSAGPLLALGSAVGLVTLVDQLKSRAWRAILIGLVLGPFFVLLPLWEVGVIVPGHGGMIHIAKMVGVASAVLLVAGVIAWVLTPRMRFTAFFAAITVAILAGGVTTVVRLQIDAPETVVLSPIKPTSYLAVGRDQITAARWIRDHSDVDDVVVTNRHCVFPVEPKSCDNRRYVVGAFSERQMLVEAWTPSTKSFELGPKGREVLTVNYWKPDILALNDGFVAAPDAAKAAKLYALGVRWIYVDYTRPYAKTLEPFAKLRYQNAAASVYELPKA